MTIAWVRDSVTHLEVHGTDGSTTLFPSVGNARWIGNGLTNSPPLPEPTDPGAGSVPGTGVVVTAGMVTAALTSVGAATTGLVGSGTPQGVADAFNEAVARSMPGVLTSKKRAAVMIGESAQESAWFQTTSEFGGPSQSYAPYYGRGFIQLTWKDNYQAFGNWMKSLGIISDAGIFVNDPDKLADVQWAPYTTLYYFTVPTWNGQNIWQIIDNSSTPWSRISRAINRGNPDSTSPAYGESERATAIDAALAVAPEPISPPTNSARMTAMLADIASLTGTLKYTQDTSLRMNITGGYADCSSLMYYLYKKHFGINVGTWTGDQQRYGTEIVTLTDTSGGLNLSQLLPGDLIFFDWRPNGVTWSWDHVEMYLGSGRMEGHGGIPYMGPVEKDVQTRVESALRVRVRRYV